MRSSAARRQRLPMACKVASPQHSALARQQSRVQFPGPPHFFEARVRQQLQPRLLAGHQPDGAQQAQRRERLARGPAVQRCQRGQQEAQQRLRGDLLAVRRWLVEQLVTVRAVVGGGWRRGKWRWASEVMGWRCWMKRVGLTSSSASTLIT
jgi:hypothetical protein